MEASVWQGVTAHFAQTYDDVYAVAFGTDEEVARLVEKGVAHKEAYA